VFDYAYMLPNRLLLDSEVYDQLRKVTLVTPEV